MVSYVRKWCFSRDSSGAARTFTPSRQHWLLASGTFLLSPRRSGPVTNSCDRVVFLCGQLLLFGLVDTLVCPLDEMLRTRDVGLHSKLDDPTHQCKKKIVEVGLCCKRLCKHQTLATNTTTKTTSTTTQPWTHEQWTFTTVAHDQDKGGTNNNDEKDYDNLPLHSQFIGCWLSVTKKHHCKRSNQNSNQGSTRDTFWVNHTSSSAKVQVHFVPSVTRSEQAYLENIFLFWKSFFSPIREGTLTIWISRRIVCRELTERLIALIFYDKPLNNLALGIQLRNWNRSVHSVCTYNLWISLDPRSSVCEDVWN